MKKFHRRFFEILIFIYFLNLTSCSKKQEMDDISIQKRYKQLYALRVCSIMKIFVEDYNKNSDYTWGINQGTSNDTERDRIVINLAQLGIKNMRYTQFPNHLFVEIL